MSNQASRSFPAKSSPTLVLPGLLLITLSIGGYCALKWYENRKDLKQVRQELKAMDIELKSARLQLEAKEMIIRRQMEMIRKAEAPATPQPSPTKP